MNLLPRPLRPYSRFIGEISDEREYQERIFIYLKPGWRDDHGAHTITGEDFAECVDKLANRLLPCTCPECVATSEGA